MLNTQGKIYIQGNTQNLNVQFSEFLANVYTPVTYTSIKNISHFQKVPSFPFPFNPPNKVDSTGTQSEPGLMCHLSFITYSLGFINSLLTNSSQYHKGIPVTMHK